VTFSVAADFFRWPAALMVDLIRVTSIYLFSYCRHFMVLIPLESRGKTLFIHVYKSKWPKISLSRVLTQPVLTVPSLCPNSFPVLWTQQRNYISEFASCSLIH
jgi:hypothetical protein